MYKISISFSYKLILVKNIAHITNNSKVRYLLL